MIAKKLRTWNYHEYSTIPNPEKVNTFRVTVTPNKNFTLEFTLFYHSMYPFNNCDNILELLKECYES